MNRITFFATGLSQGARTDQLATCDSVTVMLSVSAISHLVLVANRAHRLLAVVVRQSSSVISRLIQSESSISLRSDVSESKMQCQRAASFPRSEILCGSHNHGRFGIDSEKILVVGKVPLFQRSRLDLEKLCYIRLVPFVVRDLERKVFVRNTIVHCLATIDRRVHLETNIESSTSEELGLRRWEDATESRASTETLADILSLTGDRNQAQKSKGDRCRREHGGWWES